METSGMILRVEFTDSNGDRAGGYCYVTSLPVASGLGSEGHTCSHASPAGSQPGMCYEAQQPTVKVKPESEW